MCRLNTYFSSSCICKFITFTNYKTIKFILVFFNVIILSSLGWNQCDGCGSSDSHYWNSDSLKWVDCTNWITNINDCFETDIVFIEDLINSFQTISGQDYIGSLDYTTQYWVEGRLESLSIGEFDNDADFIIFNVVSYRVFSIFFIQTSCYAFLVNYLHRQYHLEDSYFNRYQWYQKCRDYHLLHHKKMNHNMGFLTSRIDKLTGNYLSQ